MRKRDLKDRPRHKHVAHIKQQVDQGQYVVDAERVAEAMLDHGVDIDRNSMIIAMRYEGFSYTEIAKELRTSTSTVDRVLARHYRPAVLRREV